MAKAVPKTSDRWKFANEVARQTGLTAYVVYVWSLALSAGNTIKGYSFLGIRGSSSGVATTANGYTNVKDAATETAYRINHQSNMKAIKASAGKSTNVQIAAIKKTLGLDVGAAAIAKSGDTSFSLTKDLTAKNPVDAATSLLSGSIDSLGKKVIYAFGILGGGLLAIMGLVLIGADIGISELNRSKGVRTIAETAGIGGAILKAGSKNSRDERANVRSEKRLTKVRRATVTKTNKQQAANLKAGKPAIPKPLTLKQRESAARSQGKSTSSGDDIPF